MYVLCKEDSLTLWSHWQTFIILFIKLVCDIREIDVNWKYSLGVLARLCHLAWGETLYLTCPKLQGWNFLPPPPLWKPKWAYDQLFFPPLLLLMLIYANSPVAHSLQADLSLIFNRGWKWILLLLVQPVCARKAAQFYPTEYKKWTVGSLGALVGVLWHSQHVAVTTCF